MVTSTIGNGYPTYFGPHPKHPNYGIVRKVLHNDFISPEDIASACGVTYTTKQHDRFYESLPSYESVLWCLNHGYMLMVGPPDAMSYLDIRSMHASQFYSAKQPTVPPWRWEVMQRFSREEKVGPVWIAFHKGHAEGSLGKASNFDSKDYNVEPTVVPTLAETAWCLTTYKAVRGINLLPVVNLRTSSMSTFHGAVTIGESHPDGLHVGDTDHVFHCGLAFVRRFLSPKSKSHKRRTRSPIV